MFVTAMLPTLVAAAQLPGFIQISRGKLRLTPLAPIAQLSEAQKITFLVSKGIDWIKGKSRLMMTFDSNHLEHKDSSSYLYVVGSVLGGNKGWISIDANKHDFLLLSISGRVKKDSPTKYLVTLYGKAESPLRLEVSGGSPTELKEGNFSVPLIIEATSNTQETILTVEDPKNKEDISTNGVRVQRITVEMVKP